jgi:hypothetical protein
MSEFSVTGTLVIVALPLAAPSVMPRRHAPKDLMAEVMAWADQARFVSQHDSLYPVAEP